MHWPSRFGDRFADPESDIAVDPLAELDDEEAGVFKLGCDPELEQRRDADAGLAGDYRESTGKVVFNDYTDFGIASVQHSTDLLSDGNHGDAITFRRVEFDL